VPLPIALIEATFAGAEHVWVSLDEPHFDGVKAIELARAGGVHAALGLALRHRGALVGVLGLGFAESAPLDERRLRTLTAIAGFPAAAIEHARASELAERRARLAQVLREFGERALTTLEVERIHQLILDTVVALTGSDQASITELVRDRVRVIAGVGKDAQLVGTRAPVELLGEALDAREPFVVGDTAQAPESLLVTLARKQGAQSFMVIAMRHQDRVIGHLFAGAPETHRYRAEELEAMRILASMAAAVIVERPRARRRSTRRGRSSRPSSTCRSSSRSTARAASSSARTRRRGCCASGWLRRRRRAGARCSPRGACASSTVRRPIPRRCRWRARS
jgi:GAF domain-containing protein